MDGLPIPVIVLVESVHVKVRISGCPPETVMRGLEAVHLLLALPLFVVVVGVDARVFCRSLRNRLPLLFQDPDLSLTALAVGMPETVPAAIAEAEPKSTLRSWLAGLASPTDPAEAQRLADFRDSHHRRRTAGRLHDRRHHTGTVTLTAITINETTFTGSTPATSSTGP